MEKESRISGLFRSLLDKIQDQVWFLQLKAKWDELDARSKMALKYFALIGGTVGTTIIVGLSLYNVARLRNEIDDKLALIQRIQSAQDEFRRLKEVTARLGGTDGAPWSQFFQDKAQMIGLDPSSVTVKPEQKVSAGSADDSGKSVGPEESVVEASVKKVNVRQLARYVHEIENGGRTVKVRRLQVDTKPDESGYLDATLIVSAFRMNNP
jgi:hypothetical protein